ncbi:MAG: AbrB/MazE/SpoVT family DNA-binding domain-containing protein [Deltaproteobacteria bacterium]|nr:AbrB/MazE/SpoVT family DNA-binding domain-containing protein [Deltaproteobacteria bacterium]
MSKAATQDGRAKVFWTGRSQAVRLPKEFRVRGEIVRVRREGAAVVLEPIDEWPEGYVASFAGVPDDFGRPPQGPVESRTTSASSRASRAWPSKTGRDEGGGRARRAAGLLRRPA